jgi:glycine/D-amino acid oxidase-like deaminating enzyme
MSSKKIAQKDLEALVVGGGPAGILSLKFLQERVPASGDLGLVEAAPSIGGRAKSALHLIDDEVSSPYPVLTGTLLAPPVVRWERQWVPMSDVSWDDKDWVANLPQWHLLAKGLKTQLMEVSVPEFTEDVFVKTQTPVNRLAPLEDGLWEVSTPDTVYRARRVVWAAGLKSLQNAVGKHEAQEFLVANPDYSGVAADFRGGVGFDVEIPAGAQWEEGFNADGVFALPVRFESKLHLMIGVVNEEGEKLTLRTFTHAHHELLAEPKTVSSFQKSLRRAVRALVQGEVPEQLQERWVVSDRIFGHRLGTPWLMTNREACSLVFVGDESDASSHLDTIGALDSVSKTLGAGGA